MHNILAIAKRELMAYFGTPIAYVFLAIFVALMLITFVPAISLTLPGLIDP